MVNFSCKRKKNYCGPGGEKAHISGKSRNIVGRNMLCSFGHHVAMCCDMLGVVGSSLKMVKFGPTTPNTSQHVATGWPNARNMLRPTMLRYVELACCDRLAGALLKILSKANQHNTNTIDRFHVTSSLSKIQN